MPDDNKTQLSRLGAAEAGFPIPEFPNPPDEFLQDPIMRGAWKRHMKAMNEWRKNLPIEGVTRVTTVRDQIITTGGGSGGQGNQPPQANPSLKEADLASVSLIAWMGL